MGASCAPDAQPRRELCQSAQRHLTELQLEALDVSNEHREAHVLAMMDAMEGASAARCAASTPDELECLLAASNLVDVKDCGQPR